MASTGNEKQWVAEITRFSLNRLYPHTSGDDEHRWLNDEIINGFFQMARTLDLEICAESNKQPYFFGNLVICNKLSTMSCDKGIDFEDTAKKYIYSALRGDKKTKWNNIYEMPADRFFFAFHMNKHYMLLIIYPNKNLIILYNPFLIEVGYSLAVKFKDWLTTELRKYEGIKRDLTSCRIECRTKGYPLQRNGDDCGVFVLASLLCEITDTPQNFSQTDITKLRHLMVDSFIKKKINVSNLKFMNLRLNFLLF
jgi:Ulp1 family protease